MSKAFRRFEILLPLRFNDGSAVPEELVADTLLAQFGYNAINGPLVLKQANPPTV